MEVQTRSEIEGLRFFTTLKEAFEAAKSDRTIWKISFNAEDGSRIRLLRKEWGWTYEDIMDGDMM